jgi:CRP-like cAMP-binding protein
MSFDYTLRHEPALTKGDNPTQALLRKLRRRDVLSEAEAAALEAVMEPLQRVPTGHSVICPGDHPASSTLLIRGFCARFNLLENGARSITQVSLTGDFVDLHSLLLKRMDHGIVALSDCVISRVPHDRLTQVIDSHPHLGRLLWLDTAVDAAIHRQWLHRMGAQDALGRLAHLICEIEMRLEAVEELGPRGFEFPLTQVDLADCLGISAVHVNRTLMALRRRDLVEWRGGQVRVLDRPKLWSLAEFDPLYLSLDAAPV